MLELFNGWCVHYGTSGAWRMATDEIRQFRRAIANGKSTGRGRISWLRAELVVVDKIHDVMIFKEVKVYKMGVLFSF